MSSKIISVVGAVAALAAMDGAAAASVAAPGRLMQPTSYAELLEPVAATDALQTLRQMDESTAKPEIQLAQWGHHHHHHWRRWSHHHHHRYWRRRWHHHHHHHHHHRRYWD